MPKTQNTYKDNEQNNDSVSSLKIFRKAKIAPISNDPLYCRPKPKKVCTSLYFKSSVIPNWLNWNLSTQTEPSPLDQKEGLALTLFATKSTPDLSTLTDSKTTESEIMESASPCTI